MITSGSVLLLAGGSFVSYDIFRARNLISQEMNSLATVIGANSAAPLEFNDMEAGKETLETLQAEPRVMAAMLFNKDGSLFASYQRSSKTNLHQLVTPKNEGVYFEHDQLNVHNPILSNNQRIGSIFIQADFESLSERVIRYSGVGFIVFVICSIVAFLLSSRLQAMISSPILNLAHTADKISADKNFSIRAAKEDNDEIGHLAERFNEMLSQLQERDEQIHRNQEMLQEHVKERTKDLESEILIRKKTEHELIEAKDEAESASLAKSDFLARMSHEFRTPMNAILGFAQLMKIEKNDSHSKINLQNIDQILKAGNHLLTLINEVLDLSLIESGKMKLSLENIDVYSVVLEVLDLINPMAIEIDIHLENKIKKEDNLVVIADRKALIQSLLNLVSNAVKYNVKNGSVIIGWKREGNGLLNIDVIDTGIGISLEKQNDLFDPFNRLGRDATNIEGTGIGLTITKNLLEFMGGAIVVESSIGKGSRFSIQLKEGRDSQKNEETNIEIDSSKVLGHSGKGHKTFLYIEDNLTNYELVKQILRERPQIYLIHAVDGKTGLELAVKHSPNLILMDINLPDMNGKTVFTKLKDNPLTSNIPVIALSADAMNSDIQETLNLGFGHYITKPIQIVSFLEKIDGILQKMR
jgi:signal transduction histidine kinase/CheY-like chemotaxis protein